MRPRAAALLFALALAACATKPPPPVAPTQAEWDAISADDYTCKASEAVTVDFQALVVTPQAFYDKCVRVRALMADQQSLIKDATGLARLAKLERVQAIAIAVKDEMLPANINTHPQFIFAVGRLRSCIVRIERLFALADRTAAPGQIPSTMPGAGICRSSDGPALFVSSLAIIPTAMD